MEKFKDRKEQREVTEVMNALLLPMLNYLNADTAIKVKKALYLLGEIEVDTQKSENKNENYIPIQSLCGDINDIIDES